MIERPIDFNQLRYMRCGRCQHEWRVDEEWLDRFDQADESCPQCGADCEGDDRPRFWARPEDPAHDDLNVRDLYWYHTSTHANWPDRDFDPAAGLTDETKQRMRSIATDGRALERWAQAQRTKALHLGTYEAAIENMLRRMRSQGNADDQFYLYRVRLDPDASIEPGVHRQRTNFVGDVQLSDVSSPGVNVYRYVNTHEDPSSISLAVSLGAIASVQCISIPLPVGPADAVALSNTPLDSRLDRIRGWEPAPVSETARELEVEFSGQLPLRFRDRLRTRMEESRVVTDPSAYSMKLAGVARLVTDTTSALAALDARPWRDT